MTKVTVELDLDRVFKRWTNTDLPVEVTERFTTMLQDLIDKYYTFPPIRTDKDAAALAFVRKHAMELSVQVTGDRTPINTAEEFVSFILTGNRYG